MGLTLAKVAELGGVTYQALRVWLQSGRLTKRGTASLTQALGVSQEWLTSASLEDVGVDLDALVMRKSESQIG